MIPRELEQILPAGCANSNAVNLYLQMVNSTPLKQSLPGMATVLRTNLIQDFFMLLRQNQTWVGIGYCVRIADTNGILWLPETSTGQLGVGSLYRFVAATNYLGSTGLRQDPSGLLASFRATSANGSKTSTNLTGICEGVIHFQLRAFATNGFALFALPNGNVPTNAVFRTSPTTNSYNFLRQTVAGYNPVYPDNLSSVYFWSNAVPGAVELELGLLEQRAWERYNAIGNAVARLAYLQRDDICSRVHLFRQRIPIRNVDPLPYQ
jgi:hypothetical protein